MTQPGSLEDLALHTLGKYIYMIYKNQKNHSQAHISSSYVHHNIIEHIPANLANKVTNGLLQSLDHWICEGESNQPAAVCELFVRSVLHPAMTEIKPLRNCSDTPELFQTCGFNSYCVANTIFDNIHLFHNLKRINIFGEYTSSRIVSFPPQLVEYSGDCDDTLIAKLAEQCKHLNVLNVHKSNITDASINSILLMKHLGKLNISETITCEGLTKLLTSYVKNFGESCKLKYLMISQFLGKHLKIITKRLPNLKVILYECSKMSNRFIMVPAYFQNVIGLKINIRGLTPLLLENIGKQLIYLSLYDDYDDEAFDTSIMYFVGKTCTCLKSFSVSWFNCNIPYIPAIEQESFPGFQTISDLQINIKQYDWYDDNDADDVVLEFRTAVSISRYVKFLLFNCANVKKVVLLFSVKCLTKYDLVKHIVEMECAQNVEELHFVFGDYDKGRDDEKY